MPTTATRTEPPLTAPENLGAASGFFAQQRGYRAIFNAANGPGPWPCFLGDDCQHGGEVRTDDTDTRTRLCIHHLDGDHSNDDPANLAAAHWSCHARHHARANPAWQRAGAKVGPRALAERLRTDPEFAAEFSATMAASVPQRIANTSPEAMDRQRKGNRKGGARLGAQRWRCDECEMVTHPGSLASHQRATGHAGRTRIL